VLPFLLLLLSLSVSAAAAAAAADCEKEEEEEEEEEEENAAPVPAAARAGLSFKMTEVKAVLERGCAGWLPSLHSSLISTTAPSFRSFNIGRSCMSCCSTSHLMRMVGWGSDWTRAHL
jgi:hypothetical protein